MTVSPSAFVPTQPQYSTLDAGSPIVRRPLDLRSPEGLRYLESLRQDYIQCQQHEASAARLCCAGCSGNWVEWRTAFKGNFSHYVLSCRQRSF